MIERNGIIRDGENLKTKLGLYKRIFLNKKQKSMIFIIIVLIIFLINKLSLFNYFGFISISDTKNIIRDFEKNYLYDSVFKNTQYLEMKKDLLKHTFTKKSKIDELVSHVKKLSKDDYTEFKYIDLLQGKVNYSLNKKMDFESKKLDDNTIYIKILSFEENAAKKFSKAVDNYKNADYLILDFRGNYSGYYSEALQIADDLLPENMEIAQIEHANSKHYYNSNSIYFDFKKIFVLLDEDSAYCSEIIALTLKENLGDKVELIGKNTKGMDIGIIYKSYYNKIGVNIAILRWNVKGKGPMELRKYTKDYNNTNLDKLKDYIYVVEQLK